MVNFPVFLTSEVARTVSSSRTAVAVFFSTLAFAAKASTMPVFEMDFTAFIAFIFFMAFIAFTIAEEREEAVPWKALCF